MLGILCARPRPWFLTSLSLSLSYAHRSASLPFNRLITSKIPVVGDRKELHSLDCRINSGGGVGGAASIWHAMLSFGWQRRRRLFSSHEGEGSWNVAWDARPARWLHHPDSTAWLLFGLSAAAAPVIDFDSDSSTEVLVASDLSKKSSDEIAVLGDGTDCSDSSGSNYRITGVVADGRCLFRAVAHMACLRNGEEAPDENRQRELADELRAQVVEELLRRRKEIERFIEEDFDVYVKRIRQPYVWGGEPELLMSSHVLRTPISVFMKERTSGSLIRIASYGEEYQKDKESHINVLFHGYGHYDILETNLDSSETLNA